MLSMDETQTVKGVRLQTFRRTYEQILAGDDPWYPLGVFMHQWFGRYTEYRAELVREAIDVPEDVTTEQWQWAVWCVASVEFLCEHADLEIPAWVMDQKYVLAEPWHYGDAEGAEEEADLREETPEPFARRNVFCEANPYRNKYDHTEYRQRRAAEKRENVA